MMQCVNDLHSALDVFLSPDSLLSLVEILEYSSTVTWGTGSSEATSVQLCWENLMSLMLFCQNLNFIWKPFNPQKSSDKNDQDGDDI